MKKSLLAFSIILLIFTWGGQFNDALAQNITIKGKVTDATTKLPIDYAAVVARGANLAEMTDAEGAYEINVAPGTTLEYSCLGYISKTIKVTEDGVQNVSLETDAISLDAVVAIGYGTTKRSDVTGAVSSVTADELKVAPVATVDQAMQGRVAGVTVNAQSGQPGQAAQVRIRGVGTVNNSSPIYVVDGVITEDISFLNSADVASMEILKDASSSAIYGSRGANGVIIITTKSGAEGKVKVSFDCYGGVQNIWRTLDLMKRDEYVETMVKIGNSDAERKELKRGFTNWLGTYRLGRDYYATPETFSYETQETDWQAEVQHKNAAIQNYHISVDGGTDKIKYSLSAGYFAQDGTIKESFYNRLTLRTNASYEITKWLKLGTNLSYITSKSRSLGNNAQYNGVLFQAISMAPWDPTHYPAGTLSKSGEDISGKIAASTNYTNVYNPFTQLETSHPNNTDERLLANGYLEIKPWEWLTFKSSISMNRYSWQNRSYREKYHFSDYDTNVKNSVSAAMGRSTEMFYENTLTFAKKFAGKHDVSFMVGQTTEEYNYYSLSGNGSTLLVTDPNRWYVSNTTEDKNSSDAVARTRRLSFLGRFFYSYDNRYLVTANFRADGSSKFPNNTWGYFPSVALAWRVSQEHFMENSKGVLDNLKLRLSWGQIGNDKISDGAFTQSIMQGLTFVSYPFGNTTANWSTAYVPGAAVTTYVNTGGKWEYTEQINLGVDFGFWNSKLYGNIDAYIRNTYDMLLNVKAPATVGNLYSSTMNVGTVSNKGIELTLGHANAVGDFRYDINGNLSLVKNRLTHLNGGERIQGGFTMCDEGLPLFCLWGWEYEGIYQSDEEVKEHQFGTSNITEHAGDARYKDQNGDGLIDTNDMVNIGNPFPWLSYGLNITMNWKGFDFSMFLQGVYGNKIYNALRRQTEGDGRQSTLSTAMRNVWTPTSTDGIIPNPSGSSRNYDANSRFVESGSYLRLKNIQLGYTIPTRLTQKFHVSSWRFYVSANNLLTFTKYSGYDPEVSGGVDWGNYPQSRTILFGTSLNF